MPFVINEPDGTLKYNFYRTNFYKTHYEKTMKQNRFIHAPYISKSNVPNVMFSDKEYVCKSLYIVKKIHEIKGVESHAEMIIELKSNTNQDQPLYACFLLKTESKTKTSVDQVIEGSEDTEIVLNDYIETNTAIIYENKDLFKSIVVVFTRPIMVSSRFSDIKDSPIHLAPYVENYHTIQVEPILGNIIEGLTTVAGYCTPISESDPSIGDEIMAQVNDKSLKNSGDVNSIISAFNFFNFFIIMSVVILFVPRIYKKLFIDLISDNPKLDSPQKRLNRVYAVDIVVAFLLFIMSIIFINHGILKSLVGFSVFGFYIFLFLIVSVIRIQLERNDSSGEFLSSMKKVPSEPSAQIEKSQVDIMGLCIDNLLLIATKPTVNDSGVVENKVSLVAFITFFSIFFILLYILYLNNLLDSSSSIGIFSPAFIFFFLALYLTGLIDAQFNKNNSTAPARAP